MPLPGLDNNITPTCVVTLRCVSRSRRLIRWWVFGRIIGCLVVCGTMADCRYPPVITMLFSKYGCSAASFLWRVTLHVSVRDLRTALKWVHCTWYNSVSSALAMSSVLKSVGRRPERQQASYTSSIQAMAHSRCPISECIVSIGLLCVTITWKTGGSVCFRILTGKGWEIQYWSFRGRFREECQSVLPVRGH